jgi:hypothetical protein
MIKQITNDLVRLLFVDFKIKSKTPLDIINQYFTVLRCNEKEKEIQDFSSEMKYDV